MRLFTILVPLVNARVLRGHVPQVPILGELAETSKPHVSPTAGNTAQVAPGIGVHFTNSYAVAAARFSNGTIRDLAKVQGDADYIDLISRWSEQDVNYEWREDCDWILTRPSGRDMHGRWKCSKQRLNRLMRSVVGLPTSRDAAILARFLSTVRITIEAELNAPITSIAPVMFPLRSIQMQAFQDALNIAGLRSTRSRHGAKDLVFADVNAAYAGVGAGMCHDWRDYYKCMSETMAKHPQSVLFLNFDNDSFSTSVRSMTTPYHRSFSGRHVHFAELGWWNLPVFEVPRAKFWVEVRNAIAEVAHTMSRPPGRIILMGEHGADEEFKVVVEAALWQVMEVDVGMMLQANKLGDAGKIAARGAAELAWRSKYWDNEDVDREMASGPGMIEL